MCGIAGILAADRPPGAALAGEVAAMLGRIAHRGPDGAALRAGEGVALGAVRLGIVDPAGGTQPMADPSGNWWIAYNGEVYNHAELRAELAAAGCRFRTRCDTEVVLHACISWGMAAVERFDGGFAFALYDRRGRTLHLARDRYGKRPLFLRDGGRALRFASEIKAFLVPGAVPLAWDAAAVTDIFAHWTSVDGDTPFAGVRQLRAGTVLTVTPAGRSERRWGGFDSPERTATIPFAAAAEQTRTLLAAAVERRLRDGAAPALLLSGGLDSAIVAHLAVKRHGPGLTAFSLAFANRAFDESGDQARLAAAFDLRPETVTIDDDAIAEGFVAALWHAEVPQFRTAIAPIYRLYEAVAARGCKVAMSGEGADEVFLGYDLFRETRLRAQWRTLGPAERREALARLYPYLDHFSAANAAALEQVFDRADQRLTALLFPLAHRLANGGFARRLLIGGERPSTALEAAARAAGLARHDPVARAQWLEFTTLLQGYLLASQGDRMAFAHGVEPRCPFLRPDLVAFAAALPETHHLSADGVEKRLLKAAFADALPAWLLAKPKQPYRAPGAAAFRAATGGLRPWVADALSPDALAATGLVDACPAARLVASIARDDRPVTPRHDQALVLLLSLSLLHRRFVAGEAPPALPLRVAELAAEDGIAA